MYHGNQVTFIFIWKSWQISLTDDAKFSVICFVSGYVQVSLICISCGEGYISLVIVNYVHYIMKINTGPSQFFLVYVEKPAKAWV